PSRVITSSRNWTQDMVGYILLFNVDFFLQNNFPPQFIESKKILSSSAQPYVELTDEQASEVEAIFETMLREKENDNKYKEELIALKTIELLILSERLFEEKLASELNKPAVEIIKRFSELLEA